MPCACWSTGINANIHFLLPCACSSTGINASTPACWKTLFMEMFPSCRCCDISYILLPCPVVPPFVLQFILGIHCDWSLYHVGVSSHYMGGFVMFQTQGVGWNTSRICRQVNMRATTGVLRLSCVLVPLLSGPGSSLSGWGTCLRVLSTSGATEERARSSC